MIDEGECDWKVIAIDAEDKWAPYINDIDDVKEQLPGLLEAIREWYRTYKIPDGKPPNRFALDEQFMNKEYATEIINECHHAWDQLVSGDKHRQIEDLEDDTVKGLVRKLSTGTLSAMAHNLEPHPEVHPEDYDMEGDDTLTF
jgi:inorganic pyrophosphatase